MTAQPDKRKLVITGKMAEEPHWFSGFTSQADPCFTPDRAAAHVFTDFETAWLVLRVLPFKTTFEIEPV